jgi:hypothetical protein
MAIADHPPPITVIKVQFVRQLEPSAAAKNLSRFTAIQKWCFKSFHELTVVHAR